MVKRILHLEDSPDWVGNVMGAIAGQPEMELIYASNKHEFYMGPYNTADLYLLDRHFPNKVGEFPEDNWENVVSFLEKDSPKIPVIILSSEPPSRNECSRYKNIREVLDKRTFSDKEFLAKIKFQLGMQ